MGSVRAQCLLYLAPALTCGSGQPDPSPVEATQPVEAAPPVEATRRESAQGPGPFRGEGPRFAARRQRDLGVRPEHLLAGDLDGDGHDDLLITTRDRSTAAGSGALLFYPGGPRGLAPSPRRLEAGGWPVRPVRLPGPLAGPRDAKPSGRVGLASRATRTLAVLEPATGALTEVWSGAAENETPLALAAGDFGADGALDLALATDAGALHIIGNGEVRRFELNGVLPRCVALLAGGQAVVGLQDALALERIDADGSRVRRELGFVPRALVEGDVDGDGAPELIVLGGDGEGRVVSDWSSAAIASDGPGAFTTPAVPIAAVAADLDGAGANELIVLGAAGLRYEVLRADGGRLRASEGGHTGQGPTSLACGDFDGDGHADLAFANGDARALSLVFGRATAGNGASFFEGPRATVPVGSTPRSLADLGEEVGVLCAKSLSFERLALGTVEPRRLGVTRTADNPRALMAVDLDGDGHAEPTWLASTGPGSGSAGVVLESDGGRLAFGNARGAAAAVALELGGTARVAVANDVDGALVLVGAEGARGALWADRPDAAPVAIALEPRADRPRLAVALGRPGSRRGVAVVELSPGAEADELREAAWLPTEGWPVDLTYFRPRPEDGGGPAPGTAGLAVLTRLDPNLPTGRLELFVKSPAQTARSEWRSLGSAAAGALSQRVLAADFNGGGYDELAVVAQNDHVVHLFDQRLRADTDLEAGLGPGLGIELRRLDSVGAHLGCLDALAKDLDGDGLPELIVANGFSNDLSVLGR